MRLPQIRPNTASIAYLGYIATRAIRAFEVPFRDTVRMRADFLLRNQKTKAVSLVEAKASTLAPLTTKQKIALPFLGKGGKAEIRGVKGHDIELESGEKFPFEDVFIVRSSGVELLK